VTVERDTLSLESCWVLCCSVLLLQAGRWKGDLNDSMAQSVARKSCAARRRKFRDRRGCRSGKCIIRKGNGRLAAPPPEKIDIAEWALGELVNGTQGLGPRCTQRGTAGRTWETIAPAAASLLSPRRLAHSRRRYPTGSFDTVPLNHLAHTC